MKKDEKESDWYRQKTDKEKKRKNAVMAPLVASGGFNWIIYIAIGAVVLFGIIFGGSVMFGATSSPFSQQVTEGTPCASQHEDTTVESVFDAISTQPRSIRPCVTSHSY